MKIINFTKKWLCYLALILIYIVHAIQYIFIILILWVCNNITGNAFRAYQWNHDVLTKAMLKLAKISLPKELYKELYEFVVEAFKKNVDFTKK